MSTDYQQFGEPKSRRRKNLHRNFVNHHYTRKHRRGRRKQTRRTFNRFWATILSVAAIFMFLFLATTGTGTYLSYRFYSETNTEFGGQVSSLHDLMPRDNLKIYDSQGMLLSQMVDQGMHTEVPLKQIAPDLINATVSAEDKNFWQNSGIDVLRIIEAAITNLEHGGIVQGGSTITQQLIKNLIVGNEANITRKLQELVLTPDINSHYSKNDIMEMYLNSIFYGNQAYGIDAAATIYFGLTDKPGQAASAQLDLAQSAMLAGFPNAPTLYNPFEHPKTTYNRFLTVLDLMLRDGYITNRQAQDAQAEASKPDFFKRPDLGNRAPHFSEYVIKQLEQQFRMARAQLSRSGMQVTTTLDIGLQDQVQKIAQRHIAELSGDNVTNAAEVIIDYHTGAIRTLLGSLDYYNTAIDGKFDVATQGYRQPGSSFKPYVYATALERGASPSQPIDDVPLSIVMPPGSKPPVYQPTNYDLLYHGHVTIRCALQNSLNVPAVKTLQHVGVNNAMATARAMGIVHTEGTPGLSMVLGGLDVNLLEHTAAFGTFANNGVRVTPYAIEKVVFTNDGRVYTHKVIAGKQVLSPQIAYIMTNILSDNKSRIPEFYDCNPLQLYAKSASECLAGNRGVVRPAAAKTGTTNDFRDNWTMGYTTDYVMGVWVGNDDNTPMHNVSGIDGAAPIWHDAMLVAEKNHPISDFAYPGGLQRMGIIYPDGLQTTDWFLPHTYPSYTAHGNSNQHTSPNNAIHPLQSQRSTQAFAKPDPVISTPRDSLTFNGHPYCSNYTFVPPYITANRSVW
jgi:1A family penicillin-binding protein